jgi:hypothetical protein
MKKPSSESALTLLEVLVVILVVAVFIAMLFPTQSGRHHAFIAVCMSHQKQLALGFNMWKDDNNGKFPWQVSTTNDGTMEFVAGGQASSQFKTLQEDYSKGFESYVCPTDKIKHAATNGATFNNDNLSYFVNFDSGTNDSAGILTGDRHLEANGRPVKPGLFIRPNGTAMNWTRELHGQGTPGPLGVLSFADGHAEVVRSANLTSAFQRQGSVTNRLAIP